MNTNSIKDFENHLANELNIEQFRVSNAIASYKNKKNQCLLENEENENEQLWDKNLEKKYKYGQLYTEYMLKNGKTKVESKQWRKNGQLWGECMFKKRTKTGGEYCIHILYKNNTEEKYKKYYRFLNGGQLYYDKDKQFYTEN